MRILKILIKLKRNQTKVIIDQNYQIKVLNNNNNNNKMNKFKIEN